MDKFLLNYSESKDSKYFILRDNGNFYGMNTNTSTEIDKASIKEMFINIYKIDNGVLTKIVEFHDSSSSSQSYFDAINSYVGLYIFASDEYTISLPAGNYIKIPSGLIENGVYKDGIYNLEIKFIDSNAEECEFQNSNNLYFYSNIKNCIVSKIKDMDWRLWINKPCEFPLAWHLHNIFTGMLYSAEYDFTNDYQYILNKLERICSNCATNSINSNLMCNCNDIDLIASNTLYTNGGNLI